MAKTTSTSPEQPTSPLATLADAERQFRAAAPAVARHMAEQVGRIERDLRAAFHGFLPQPAHARSPYHRAAYVRRLRGQRG